MDSIYRQTQGDDDWHLSPTRYVMKITQVICCQHTSVDNWIYIDVSMMCRSWWRNMLNAEIFAARWDLSEDRDADFYLRGWDSGDTQVSIPVTCFYRVSSLGHRASSIEEENASTLNTKQIWFDQRFLLHVQKRVQMPYWAESRSSSTCQRFVIWLFAKLKPSGSSVGRYYRSMPVCVCDRIIIQQYLTDLLSLMEMLTDCHITSWLNACYIGGNKSRVLIV